MNLSFLWIIAAGVAWGLDGLLRSKIVGISPLTIVTVEHIIAFVVLAVIGFNHLRFPKLTSRWWLALIGVSLFSGLIGTYAFTWAMVHIDYTSFGVMFLILKLQPLFAILAALIFLRERPKNSFYPLALIALIASYFLSFGKSWLDMSFWSDVLRATLAGLVAALCWGSATVFSRYLSHQGYKARTMTAFRLGLVAILGIIAIGISTLIPWSNSLALPSNPTQFLLIVSGVALLSWVLGTTMYYRGIRHTEATRASIFELAFPITRFVIDIFIQHQTPDIFQILGGVFLILVMILVARTKQ